MNKIFLESIMDIYTCRKLTICGSARFRELKEKYQAYYTIKNNLVLAPAKYLAIKDEVEKTEDDALLNAYYLMKIHDNKINLSEAIIVVTDEKCYYGDHTAREIKYAKDNKKIVLWTNVKEEDKDKYYFNNNQTYPLYILKED